MARIKPGKETRARHKRVLKLAKGYRQQKSKIFRRAQEAVLHAGQYAYSGRKKRKRDFRQLWITRISQAVEKKGMKYHDFIFNLKKNNILLDRKILATLIAEDPKTFTTLISSLK